MALTELALKHLKPQAKLYRVADGGGLCIEVSTTGSKLWRWRYTYQGRPQMLALGKYPQVTLAQARKLRDQAREKAQEGKHLTREKKAQKLRQAEEGENTFEKVARQWLDTRQKLNKKYQTQCIARMQDHVFPRIGSLPITEITIPEVVKVIEKIGSRGTIVTAKRMGQLINQVFRYASQRGICTHNPASDLRDILPKREEKHHACIHPDELAELLTSIDSRKNDLTKAALKLANLTFVRTNELIGARWEEIDWERREWTIPKERMKIKERSHTVPLSRQALAIFRELQEHSGSKANVFYSAASRSMHISNGAMLMGLRRMGYKGRMTGHGFRSLASTILNEHGFSPDVIERQLAHKDDDKVRAAYKRAEYMLERRKMMQWWADYLDNPEQNNPRVIEGRFGAV